MKTGNQEEQLNSVRGSLHELHRLLLSVLKKDRERVDGRVFSPAEWFQMLLGAPDYQWVKPLNSLLSDVDALSESSQIVDQDLAILRHELESLFFKDNSEVTSFNFHYRQLFANNHDIMFSHGQLRQLFSQLANVPPPLNMDDIRRGWHKVGIRQRKLLN